MRILLATLFLGDRPGGSERHAQALALELQRRGHAVSVHSHHRPRGMAEELVAEGVTLETVPLPENYDAVLASHYPVVAALLRRGFARENIVQTCHGCHIDSEKPHPGAGRHVAVSEEVATAIGTTDLVPNGVDCGRFVPRSSVRKRLRRVLGLCQGDRARRLLAQVCSERGLLLEQHDPVYRPAADMPAAMNAADLVVTLGRGAAEALACGRIVLVMDERGYVGRGALADGLLRPETFAASSRCNHSGRGTGKQPDAEYLHAELDRYDPALGDWGRLVATERYNVQTAAGHYLRLIDSAAVGN